MEKRKVITATGQDSFDLILKNFDEFEIVDTISYKKDLLESVEAHTPDILIITDNIGGKEYLYKLLIDLRVKYPNVRVVYFCGKIDFTDNIRLTCLNNLIAAGIYDIIDEPEIDVNLIRFILNNPRERSQLDYIESKYAESIYINRTINPIKFTYNALEEDDEIDSNVFRNLHVFIASKHGAGKSFILENMAIAIANMGINKKGAKPRVAIIDFDFENFSISNSFDTFNDEKNVMKAIDEAQRIVTEYGIKDNLSLQHEVVDNIKKMFVPTKKYSNIKILCGSNKVFKEEEYTKIRHNDIVFIIETIVNDYDIILVDTNSDAEYSKIYPLFSMARNVYSVIEMNLNVFSGDSRLRGHIDTYLSSQKLKYILNKDIENVSIKSSDIEEQLGYKFVAKVPCVPYEKMFEIACKKDFVINQNDKDLLKVRYELIKAANDVWPIKNFDVLNSKMRSYFHEDESEEIQEKTYSSPLVKMVMEGLGIDSKDTDAIKTSIKNSNVVDKAKDFTFKGFFSKLNSGAKEINKDLKNEKTLKLEDKTNNEVTFEGPTNETTEEPNEGGNE